MKNANLLYLIEVFSKKNSFFMSKFFFKKWKFLIEEISPLDSSFNLHNSMDPFFKTSFHFDDYGELPIVFYSSNMLNLIRDNKLSTHHITFPLSSSDLHSDIPDDFSLEIDYGQEPILVCLLPYLNKLEYTVIDGNHRIAKAKNKKVENIEAHYISPNDLSLECFVNIESYVNYVFLIECFILGTPSRPLGLKIYHFFSITLKRIRSKSI